MKRIAPLLLLGMGCSYALQNAEPEIPSPRRVYEATIPWAMEHVSRKMLPLSQNVLESLVKDYHPEYDYQETYRLLAGKICSLDLLRAAETLKTEGKTFGWIFPYVSLTLDETTFYYDLECYQRSLEIILLARDEHEQRIPVQRKIIYASKNSYAPGNLFPEGETPEQNIIFYTTSVVASRLLDDLTLLNEEWKNKPLQNLPLGYEPGTPPFNRRGELVFQGFAGCEPCRSLGLFLLLQKIPFREEDGCPAPALQTREGNTLVGGEKIIKHIRELYGLGSP